MFDNLTSLGLGITVFAVMIGVGVVVLDKFGQATGGTANTTAQYLITQMGSSGLAGRGIPAAYTIGILFIGAFIWALLMLKSKNRKY